MNKVACTVSTNKDTKTPFDPIDVLLNHLSGFGIQEEE